MPFISLGSQKNYLGLYLFCTYGDEEAFRRTWAATGKKLDMGDVRSPGSPKFVTAIEWRAREDSNL